MRQMIFFVLVVGLFGQARGMPSTTSSDPCEAAGVGHLRLPYFYDQADSATFDYAYYYHPAKEGAVTAIFLTGGPGQTSIDTVKDSAIEYPKDFGLLLIDYRGLGCNRPRSTDFYPDGFYTSENMARDVVEVIKALRLNRYVLSGVSFGSMVATEVAGMTERGLAPKPLAVALAGTVGHADQEKGDLFSEYMNQWDLAKAALPADIVALLNGSAHPLGLSAEEWGNWISDQLTFAAEPPSNHSDGIDDSRFEQLSLLRPNADLQRRSDFVKQVRQNSIDDHTTDPATERLYRLIMCHEDTFTPLNSNTDADFKFENGELVPEPSDLCRGISMDHPFDSAQWQITSPIYYFAGTKDPSTPIPQAFYHLHVHPEAPRIFIELPEAAHSALYRNLRSCEPAIWNAIIGKAGNLRTALATCPSRANVTKYAIGEGQ